MTTAIWRSVRYVDLFGPNLIKEYLFGRNDKIWSQNEKTITFSMQTYMREVPIPSRIHSIFFAIISCPKI